MRRNLQRLMVAIAAMMICLGASAIDKVVKKATLSGEVTSVEGLKSSKFLLANGEGDALVILYTPSGWDIKVENPGIAADKSDNGGLFQLTELDTHYLIPVFNFDGSRRTFWAGNQSVNAQPTGNVIFGLDGDNAQHGQDGANLAVWDVAYEEGKGFTFHCVGRDIYISHANGAACPSATAVYWKAYTEWALAYDVAGVEAAGTAVANALKASDAKTTFDAAKLAYEADKTAEGAIDKYAAAINAAIDVVNACDVVKAAFAGYKLSTLGTAAVKEVETKYNAGEYKDAAELSAAYVAAVKTQNAVGSDFTGAIVNPSFELGNTNGWTYDNSNDHGAKENSNGTYTMQGCDGKYLFNIWSSGNAISQTIEGLPNGTYKLQAVIATDADHKVQLNGNDKNAQIAAVDKGTGVEGEVEFEVTDGKATIGAEGVDKYWYKVDNFRLTLVNPANAKVPEKDAWYTGADFFRFRADKNASAESPYIAYKDKVEPAWGAAPLEEDNGCIVCKVPANVDPKSQIWIRGTEAGKTIANGSKDGFRVTFRVKADGEYKGLESQAHNGWGYKTGGSPFGTLDVTTEWQTVSFVCTGEKAKADFTDLCFNLSGDTERTFYFDDVQIVRGDEGVIGSESVVKVYNNVWYKGTGINDLIKSDDKGNYVEVVSPAKAEQDWDSQIFISIPEEFVGKQVTLTMDVKASAAVSADAQLHKSNDGEGYTSAPAGDAVPFTTEWTTITRTLDTSAREVPTWWGGKDNVPETNTYVLNLTKADETSYGFKNISFAQAQEDWYVATTPTARTYEGFTEEFVMADGEKVPYKNSWEADGTTHTYNDGVSIKYTKTLPEFAALPFDFKDSCIKIKSNDMPINDYDCQFFIKVSDKPLKKNQIVTVSMKVKTDSETEVSVGTGVHFKVDGWTPNASDALTFKVSADWQDIVGKFDVTHEDLIEGTGKGGVWYALSLSDQKAEKAHNYWFDDITVKIEDAPVLAWEDLIPLQDFEAGYTGADDEPIYFLSKENVVAEGDTHRSRIVEGAGKDSKNGIEFRTVGGSANWDSQFEIRFPYQLPNGTTYKLEFDYKVDATANFGTQSWDGGVGSYATGGTAAMKVAEDEIGTWKHYSEEYKVNYTRKDGDNVTSEGLRWDVFDMAQSGQPNAIVFIDNISVQVPKGTLPFKDGDGNEIAPDYLSATEYPIYTYIDPTTLDWTDNIFTNGDVEGEDMSSFISKVNDDEDALLLPAATKVFKESNQVMVKTAAREKDPADETKYLGNDHDTQFFVRLPYALKKGTKFFFSVDYISNKVADVQSQTHAEPGEWKSNTGVGKITTGSTSQTLADYFTADNDMRTIAFNLASATEGGTFYFDNFVFKVVKDEEADIKAFTQTWDETSKWNETLALNVAYDNGRNAETEGCTAESVKTLDDAMAAGKAILQPAEGAEAATKDAIAAAAKAIEDAIAGLTKGKPELAYTDLTKEMFFHWNAADETAEALEASNCDYNIGTSTGQPYGLSTVNHDRFADLSAYNTIELTATEGEPRLLFNRIENEGTVFAEVPRDAAKYETVVDNGDGSKTYVIDIAAIVAEYGFAHLHAIKGANWANTTVTEIKLGYVGEKPELPIPTAIEGVETEGESIADGKYIENGQIVIVKGGKKYTVAGVEIK